MQAGHLLSPQPTGLVALYGDVFVGDWYAKAHSPDAVVAGLKLGEVEKYSAAVEKYFEPGRAPVSERPFGDGTYDHSLFYHYLVYKGECKFCGRHLSLSLY